LKSITLGSGITSIGRYAFSGSSLENVYYFGTVEDWNNISIEEGNEALTNAAIYYYSEGEPTEIGNYWHYDQDGVTPVIWSKFKLEIIL
jgi:hypothetical protein